MNKVYAFFQSLFGLIVWLLSKFWFRLEVTGSANLRPLKRPVIFIPNHRSRLDSFLILASLPLAKHFSILPVRTMTSEIYLNTLVVGSILKLMGCYPSRKGQGLEASLAEPLKLIKQKIAIGIFPEGQMNHQSTEIGQFKRGIGQLVQQVPQVPLLPIIIKGTENCVSWKLVPRFGDKIRLHFGPLFLVEANQSAEAIAEQIRQKMIALAEKV